MAVFDVSFLNPKLRPASKDYGFLIDQLSILENKLSSDGKLAPGDYEILIGEANKLYAHPGLTKDQRSNVSVKISAYERERKTDALKQNQDVARLNREVEDDFNIGTMTLAANPLAFLRQRSDALRVKIDQLTSSIEQLNSAGDDATLHVNEVTSTLKQYKNALEAYDDTKKAKNDGKPGSGQVAFITTNSRGEITDLAIDRIGSKTGYLETNGLYGPFQIYGKANRKDENGKLVFRFGPNSFSAPDIVTPDPTNPGSFRSPKLISESQQIPTGPFTRTAGGQFHQVNLDEVSPMNSIEINDYIQGDKGFIYKRNANGKFTKYVGQTPEQLNISPADLMRVPKYLEAQIIGNVETTVDPSASTFSPAAFPSASIPSVSATSTPAPSVTAPTATPQAGGPVSTPSPQTRSPQSALGYARATLGKATSFLGSLFRGE